MDEDIIIRLATTDDLPSLEKVGDELFDYAVKPERAKEFLDDPRHHLVLAFRSSQIIGMASGFHYVHPDKDAVLFMNEVSVLDAFQSQGIGRELVKSLWEHALKLGCHEAWIGTERSNIAAQKCYLAAGGNPEKEHVVMFEFEDDDRS